MKPKYISITAIVCALIIGGSYYAVQVNKQNSIMEQQRLELEAEQRARQAEKLEQEEKELSYDWCVMEAEAYYWDYMELNGTLNEDGTIYAETRFWDAGKKKMQQDIDNCYNRYLK